jgi:hypothetical protein
MKVDIQLKDTKLIEIEADTSFDLARNSNLYYPDIEKTSYVDFRFEDGSNFSSKFSCIDILELFAWFYDYDLSANTSRELCLSWMQYHAGDFETNGNTIVGCWFNTATLEHIEYEYHCDERYLDTSKVYEKEKPQ